MSDKSSKNFSTQYILLECME